MATKFDEILIDSAYSADGAEGGPEFATVIIRSGEGGAIAGRSTNREDYVSRYEIQYGELSPLRRRNLRNFSILREGMARGFRFLAPDDSQLIDDYVGRLNPATGDILPAFDTDGVTSVFYLIQYLSDVSNIHTRRIIKPSPFDDFTVDFYNSANPGELLMSVEFPADSGVGAFGVIAETISEVSAIGAYTVTLNLHQGKIIIDPAPDQGFLIKVTGVYHVPVAFAQDWQKFSIDDQGVSGYRVGLEEILPAELGII